MIFYNRLSPSVFALFASIFITALGFLLFYQRSQDASSLLNITTYDAQMYLNMANGIEVPGPHSCRILLPYLARLLPMESLQSIYIINIISFVVLFYSLVEMLERFSINRTAIILSLAIFFSTYSVAYNFTNPFLADVPALAAMILFINSIIKYRYISSLFWFATSLLFRETIVVLIPLFFLTFSIKQSIAATIFSLLVYLIPKVMISGNIYCNFNTPFSLGLLLNFEFLTKTILSYGPIWFLGFVGLIKLKKYGKHLFKISFAILVLSFIGSVLSSLKSVTDVTRMYFLMFPILILGSAIFINNIYSQKQSWTYLIAIVVSGFFVSIGYFPNIIINGDFNSLKEFAKSNYILIVPNLTLQLFMIIYIIIKFNYKK